MKIFKKKIMSLILTLTIGSIICQCISIRFVSSNHDPQKIYRNLSKEDIYKLCKVYFKSGDLKTGILLAFTEQYLKLHDRETQKSIEISYDLIEKIEFHENKYWYLVLLVIISLGVITHGFLNALGEGIAEAGV